MKDENLRIVEIDGRTELAWDYATRDDGTKAAVIGPNAVQCPRCNAYQGKPCQTPDEKPLGMTHFDRTAAMKLEISLLLAPPPERDSM